MSKNINGHEVVFFNYDNVVGAVIKDCKWDVLNIIRDNDCYMISDEMLDRIEMQNTMKAIAVCSPEDTFDLEKGKKIAYYRLKQKYYDKVRDRLFNVSYVAFELARNIRGFSEIMNERSDNAQEKWERICDGVEHE